MIFFVGLVIYLICWLLEWDPVYWYVSPCLLCHFLAGLISDYLACIWLVYIWSWVGWSTWYELVFLLDYSLKLLVFDTDTYIGTALDPALNPFSDCLIICLCWLKLILHRLSSRSLLVVLLNGVNLTLDFSGMYTGMASLIWPWGVSFLLALLGYSLSLLVWWVGLLMLIPC
jgi:hypothetical protein